jgi:hypothetical protein
VTETERYPLRRGGGLFLAFMGSGIVLGVVFRGRDPINAPVLLAGATIAMLSLVFARRWAAAARPSRTQVAALLGAIALELGLFVLLGLLVPVTPQTDPRLWWLSAMTIVGAHFLPMGLTFGPEAAALGGLCMINAGAGIVFPDLPFSGTALLDGTLKVAFGAWLFLAASRSARPRPS